jgi:hypothetical protein
MRASASTKAMPEEHVGAQDAGGLGLAGDALEGLADEDAIADAGPIAARP